MFMNSIWSYLLSGMILTSAMCSTNTANVNGKDIITFNFKPENTEVRYSIPSDGYGPVNYEIIRDEPSFAIIETPVPVIIKETPAATQTPAPTPAPTATLEPSIPTPTPEIDESIEQKTPSDSIVAQYGDMGGIVYKIQQALAVQGYLYGSIDGDFGGQTEQAIKTFQEHIGCDATGILLNSQYELLLSNNYSNNSNSTSSSNKRGEPADEIEVKDEIYAQYGDINEDVRAMQNALINLGYLYGPADGDFGSNTENAVKQFQQANAFEVDGVMTESQAEKLWKSSKAISATRSNSSATQVSTTKSSAGNSITSNSNTTQANSVNERTVYITPTGKKYHYLASCAGKNASATTLDRAKRSYDPCKKCVG